jgi:hypothetical protein
MAWFLLLHRFTWVTNRRHKLSDRLLRLLALPVDDRHPGRGQQFGSQTLSGPERTRDPELSQVPRQTSGAEPPLPLAHNRDFVDEPIRELELVIHAVDGVEKLVILVTWPVVGSMDATAQLSISSKDVFPPSSVKG